MEADLFPFGRGREQCDRTRNERQLQITFPIRTRGDGCSTIRIKRRSDEKFARDDKPLAPLEGVFALTCRIRRGVDGASPRTQVSHQDEGDSTEPALDLTVGGHVWI